MASSARKEEEEEERLLRVLFNEYDADRSGAIDAGEIAAALLRLRLPAGPADVAAVVATADANGDGKISYTEFAEHLRARRTAVRAAFTALDHDGDGRLSGPELAAALQQIAGGADAGPPPDAATVDALMALLDTSGDGAVDFNEFLAATVLLPRVAVATFMRQFYSGTLVDSGDGALIPPPPKDTAKAGDGSSGAAGTSSGAGKAAAHAPSTGATVALSLASGAIAGAVSRTATAPLDRVKILLQVAGAGGGGKAASPGIVGTIRTVYTQGGLRAFFVGNGVNVLKVMPELGLRFASFEAFRTYLFRDSNAPSPAERFIAGGMAGIVSQSIVYPLDVIKTRLAASAAGEYRGLADCFRRTVAGPQGGVPALYRGIAPMLVGSFPYAAIDMAILSLLKDLWIERATTRAALTDGKVQRPSTAALLVIAATASGVASVCTYPLNLVRTRLQAQGMKAAASGSAGAAAPRYTGTMDCLRRTWAAEGIRGLYRGLGTSLLKSLPSASTSYLVYETSKRYLEGPILGKH